MKEKNGAAGGTGDENSLDSPIAEERSCSIAPASLDDVAHPARSSCEPLITRTSQLCDQLY